MSGFLGSRLLFSILYRRTGLGIGTGSGLWARGSYSIKRDSCLNILGPGLGLVEFWAAVSILCSARFLLHQNYKLPGLWERILF